MTKQELQHFKQHISKALDIGSPDSCIYMFLPEDIQEAGKCLVSCPSACMAVCCTAAQDFCLMRISRLCICQICAGMIRMPCAGLESMTQVFSVISSCIVDESVGRCSPHSLTPISLARRNSRLLSMQAPAGVQLNSGPCWKPAFLSPGCVLPQAPFS